MRRQLSEQAASRLVAGMNINNITYKFIIEILPIHYPQ